jgi:Protein of unknown function (DUF1549)/Protein of unknown function (DUF1553)
MAVASEPLSSHSEFSIDVMSVLSKSGCNTGACHGNLNGKGGLKLTLRGQDPADDFQALAVASRGRRINIGSPEASLILQKATGQLAHIGGTRFHAGSAEYEVLRRWIERGAPPPSDEEPRLERLQVEPMDAIVRSPQTELAVHVKAHFSDGTSREVSDRACYELSNLDASVDSKGVVQRHKPTELTLIVRYLHLQVPVRIAFIEARDNFDWSKPTPNNFVDRHVFAKLERLRLNPSSECSDTVFVRRAYLDAIGRGPSVNEAQEFVFDTSADKRERLINDLLHRPEFSDFWALKWADILRTEEKVLDPQGVDLFHAWIRESIAVGKPIDQFVRELVTGVGSTFENPPANFYRANRDPSTRGETTARLFLGIRMQCAKCHNHPFDHWTQDDYYQWSNVFSQIDYELGENKRKDKLDKNEFAGEQTVLLADKEEVVNPNSDIIAKPKFLGGEFLSEAQTANRLDAVGVWLTSKDNDLFAKSQANFIWYHLMGSGLVDPIDDFRLTNPASNPQLLESLASHLIENQFDLRSLVRIIMNSKTYQLSSEHNETNLHDQTSYSHVAVRRLPAEVLLDLQSDVLDLPATFAGFDAGLRAVQVPGVERVRSKEGGRQTGDSFLKTFGRPERIMACDCERSGETTLKQALSLLGSGLNSRLADKQNWLAKISASPMSDSELVDSLYWRALSRPPSEAELKATLTLLQQAANSQSDAEQTRERRFAIVQDIAWALMNAKEFLFRR